MAASEVGLLALTVRTTVARAGSGRDEDSRAFALWVIAIILLAPTAWFHYLVLLFRPFAQIAIATGDERAARRTVYMAIVSYGIAVFSLFVWMKMLPYISLRWTETSVGSLVTACVAAYWFVRDAPCEMQVAVSVASH